MLTGIRKLVWKLPYHAARCRLPAKLSQLKLYLIIQNDIKLSKQNSLPSARNKLHNRLSLPASALRAVQYYESG